MLLQLQQLFITLLFTSHMASSSQGAVNTDGNNPNSESKLDLDEFDGHFSDPSANAAMIKHIDDMAFIEIPHGTVNDTRVKRNAIRYKSALWPNARVPYVFAPDFSPREREVVLQAMRHWEDNTCIRFAPRSREIHYLYIFAGDGCYSYVGRIYSAYQPQGVSLGRGCVYASTAIHELGHAVGFYHEHTRADRDEYVSVLTNNIRSGQEDNFEKFRPGATLTFGYGYDYASIMHYRSNSFSRNSQNTIAAKDSGIAFGNTKELSPLDILKANVLYSCALRSRPPISTFPQSVKPLTLPDGVTCGSVIEGRSGTYFLNQNCAWVIRVPDGYNVRIRLPSLNLGTSSGCGENYVQILRGRSIDSKDGERLARNNINGIYCASRNAVFAYAYDTTATIYYHTGGRNTRSPQGLQVDFSISDINECFRHRCHRCTNFGGSYRCECNEGYYHSPAAATCFDYNECAYGNGGCDHICDNNGGSYVCKCNSGYFLQADGLSCRTTPPGPPTTPPPPTPPPTSPPPPPPTCGGVLTSSTGALQTPKWPETYPFNFDCEWTISIPNSNQVVELTFDNVFGIAGKTVENCPKDHLKIYEGTALARTICDLQVPTPIRTNSNRIRLVFHAGPSHGPLRKGFKITYKAVNRPTIAPPPTTVPTTVPTTAPPTTTQATTLPQTTQPPTPSDICGPSLFTRESGSFQTPSWPNTYPFNFNCEWKIELPLPGCTAMLSFDNTAFGIAGKTSDNCPKDYLKIYAENGRLVTTICDLTLPSPILVPGNVKLSFFAGPYHGPLRKGFKITYTTICPTTPPPTTRPTTIATTTPRPTTRPTTIPTTQPTTSAPTPNCLVLPSNLQGSFGCSAFLQSGSSFGPENFPTGPISNSLSCQWIVFGSGSFRVRFKYFDIPNNNECSNNYVAVYDGFSAKAPMIEKMCGEKCDEFVVEGTTNFMTVAMEVSSPGDFRGFYAHFEQN